MKKSDGLYRPAEVIELQQVIKSIYDDWFSSTERPKQSFVNATLVGLHKAGYKIVKIKD